MCREYYNHYNNRASLQNSVILQSQGSIICVAYFHVNNSSSLVKEKCLCCFHEMVRAILFILCLLRSLNINKLR